MSRAEANCATLGAMSQFDELGGEASLRAIIDRFVDRVFDDLMIGFFFARTSRARIKEKEYEHAAEFLGGPVTYSGRALDVAHARHPIQGGHFQRRLAILRATLDEARVPPSIRDAWLAHQEALRPLVTADPGSECDGTTAFARTAARSGS